MIEILNVNKENKNNSFKLPDQGVVSIVGEKNSGKNELLNSMSLLDKLPNQHVKYNGFEMYSLSKKKKDIFRSQYVGTLTGNFELFRKKTVMENLELALESTEEFTKLKMIDDWLEKLDIKKYKDTPLYQLKKEEEYFVKVIFILLKEKLKYIFIEELDSVLKNEELDKMITFLKEIATDKLVVVTLNEKIDSIENQIHVKNHKIIENTIDETKIENHVEQYEFKKTSKKLIEQHSKNAFSKEAKFTYGFIVLTLTLFFVFITMSFSSPFNRTMKAIYSYENKDVVVQIPGLTVAEFRDLEKRYPTYEFLSIGGNISEINVENYKDDIAYGKMPENLNEYVITLERALIKLENKKIYDPKPSDIEGLIGSSYTEWTGNKITLVGILNSKQLEKNIGYYKKGKFEEYYEISANPIFNFSMSDTVRFTVKGDGKIENKLFNELYHRDAKFKSYGEDWWITDDILKYFDNEIYSLVVLFTLMFTIIFVRLIQINKKPIDEDIHIISIKKNMGYTDNEIYGQYLKENVKQFAGITLLSIVFGMIVLIFINIKVYNTSNGKFGLFYPNAVDIVVLSLVSLLIVLIIHFALVTKKYTHQPLDDIEPNRTLRKIFK